MATRTDELKIKITGDASQANKTFNSLGTSLSNLGPKLAQLGKMAAVAAGAAVIAGIGAISAVVKKSISNFIDNELIQTKLNNTIKNTGQVTGVTADMVNKLATEMQRLTRFEDDNVSAAGEVLARYRTIGKDTFPQVLALSADLAESLGVDIVQAAEMMGKALVAPGEGMRVLKQAGVALTDAQQAMIDKLMAAGKTAEAQKLILDLLSQSIGGVAQAAGNTSSGKLDQLKNTLDGFFDRIGEALGPGFTTTLDFLVTSLQQLASDPMVINGIRDIGLAFSEWAKTDLPGMARSIRDIVAVLSLPPSQAGVGIFDAIGKASKEWMESKLVSQMITDLTNLGTVMANITMWSNTLGVAIRDGLGKAIQNFNKSKFANALRDAMAGIAIAIDGISRAIKNVLEWFAKLPAAVPSWLIPGSPTPFEIGLRGISSELDNISKMKLPNLTGGVSLSTGGAGDAQTTEMANIRDEIRFLVRTLPKAIANANA